MAPLALSSMHLCIHKMDDGGENRLMETRLFAMNRTNDVLLLWSAIIMTREPIAVNAKKSGFHIAQISVAELGRVVRCEYAYNSSRLISALLTEFSGILDIS
jgi:hypothetical protein